MKLAVTGANRGIGLALVKEATHRGYETLACIRSEENATAVEGLNGVSVALADVRDPIALNNAAKSFGSLDLLVANAGRFIGRWGIEDPEYTPAAFEEVLMTNVAGAFFLLRGHSCPTCPVLGARLRLSRPLAHQTPLNVPGIATSTRVQGSSNQHCN